MKIAFIKRKYVPFGGGEGYLQRLMRCCFASGYSVHLITASWAEEEFDFPVIVHTVPMKRSSRRSMVYSFAESAQKCVESNDFDCVFSLERTIGQDIWRAGEGVHKVWLEHRAEFEPAWKTLFNTLNPGHRAYLDMEERCVRSTRHIIANSAMVKGYIESTYPHLNPEIHVIHNGCDTDYFNPDNRPESRSKIAKIHGFSVDEPLIIFPGNDWIRKGLEQAFLTMTRIPEVRLIIVGRGKPAKWRRLARKYGIEKRIYFVSPTPDIRTYYRASDAALLPTWSDPFANVTLEAIACGTPLVTTKYNGGCEVVLPGNNGYVADHPTNAKALAEGINTMLSRRHEPDRAAAISATVADYTMARNWSKTLAVVKKAVSGIPKVNHELNEK